MNGWCGSGSAEPLDGCLHVELDRLAAGGAVEGEAGFRDQGAGRVHEMCGM